MSKDIFAKSILYKKWFDAFDKQKESQMRLQILNRWIAETNLVTNKSIRGQILLEIAQSATDIAQGEMSRKLFNQSFTDLFDNDNVDKYSDELSVFIQACFTKIDLVRDLIRTAVFKVLTLSDDWKKTFVLTELASFYTEKGEGGIQVLLQHAIANASGIQNPFLKGEAFARIARGFESLNLSGDAGTYWTLSKEIFEDLNVLTLSESDAESLARTLQIFLNKGLIPEVNTYSSLLTDVNQRAEVVAGLAGYYSTHNQTLLFRVNAQKIATTLQSQGTLNIDGLFRLYTRLYLQISKQDDKDFVSSKMIELASSTSLSRAALIDGVGRLASAGDSGLCRRLADIRKKDMATILLLLAKVGETKAYIELSDLGPVAHLDKELLAPWALIEASKGNTGILKLAYANIKSSSDAVEFIIELYRILRANDPAGSKLDEIFEAISPNYGSDK